MVREHFHSYSNYAIGVKIECSACHEPFETSKLEIPEADWNSETDGSSYNSNIETIKCPKCTKEYELTIWNGFNDAFVDFASVQELQIQIIEYPNPEWSTKNPNHLKYNDSFDDILENFVQGIGELSHMVTLAEEQTRLRRTILSFCYAGLITQLETYLSDIILNSIKSNKLLFENFITTFPKFKKEKFTISEFFSIKKGLKFRVEKELKEIIYHNLFMIKPMIESIFKTQSPEISNLSSIVKKRHDIVHRNRKTKDGAKFEIDFKEYDLARESITKFVMKVHEQIILAFNKMKH